MYKTNLVNKEIILLVTFTIYISFLQPNRDPDLFMKNFIN